MRKHRLPSPLIVRNVLFMLMAWVGMLLVAVDTHDSANAQSQQTENLRRLFIYQVVTQVQRGS